MSDFEKKEINKFNEAAESIRSKLIPELSKPRVLIICGSGLGGIAEVLHPEPIIDIPYNEIPHFKHSTVQGHAGKLLIGFIGKKKVPVVCMVGRLHYYEGHDFADTVFPVRVAKVLGIETLVATNAAGGLNRGFKAGDIMVINDHINMPGFSAGGSLRGPNLDSFGPRFLPLSDAYDLNLRKLFFETAKDSNISRAIHEGVYVFVSGPTYETRAESRFLHLVGADAVGMSTVAEVITARHSGLKVFALSLITNESVVDPTPKVGDEEAKKMDQGIASHAEVIENANLASKDVQKLIAGFVAQL